MTAEISTIYKGGQQVLDALDDENNGFQIVIPTKNLPIFTIRQVEFGQCENELFVAVDEMKALGELLLAGVNEYRRKFGYEVN